MKIIAMHFIQNKIIQISILMQIQKFAIKNYPSK